MDVVTPEFQSTQQQAELRYSFASSLFGVVPGRGFCESDIEIIVACFGELWGAGAVVRESIDERCTPVYRIGTGEVRWLIFDVW